MTTTIQPGLYVIATPIGNLGDITQRAITCLKSVDMIACEDKRVTKRLLDHLGISANLLAYHEHSPVSVRERLLGELRTGKRIALVSDAGTPCLADPGFKLVEAAALEGIEVIAIPGPSSITAALSISGLPTDRHYFEGFLPNKSGERQRRLKVLSDLDATLVLLESPHRIIDSLSDTIEVLGNRRAALAREITKHFEEVIRGTLTDIKYQLAQRQTIKGEIVLLIDRNRNTVAMSEADIDAAIKIALMDHKPSRAAAAVAKATGVDRETIYQRVLSLKDL